MKTALIVAPHPDDAELAMGGSIVKMTAAGWNVVVADLTDGEPTPFGSKESRAKETQIASNILGIEKRICLDMPNRYLQPTLQNRKRLAEMIRLNKPDILFGPVIPDWHPDHEAARQLIDQARFEAKFYKTKMRDAPHWTTRQFYYYSPHRLEYSKPSFIIDITSHWEKKIAAIKAYKSQIKNIPRKSVIGLNEKIEIINRYFGQCINVKYAEPFFSSEPISVKSFDVLT